MKKRVALFALVAGLLISPTSFVFAYNDQTTHPALTQETADYFNRTQGGLTQQQVEWMIAGATAEDTFPRWINHFYDPVHDVGWTGAGAGNLSPQTVQAARAIGLSYEAPASTIQWLNSYALQQSYGMYGGNHTWERGLEYAAENNEEQEFRTLGHILHLLQDMAVPDHTRDDTHAGAVGEVTGDPGSPYENYAAGFNRENIKKLNIPTILEKGNSPPSFTSPEEYLRDMAVYSNKYFYSKDTIDINKYQEPKIQTYSNQWAIGKDELNRNLILASANVGALSTTVYLSEKSNPVFQDYFIRLGPKAVWYGAGLIRLYLKQAEDKKVNVEFEVTDRDALKKVARSIVLPNVSVGAIANSAFSFVGNVFSQMGAAVSGATNSILQTVGLGWSNANIPSSPDPSPSTVADIDGVAMALASLTSTSTAQVELDRTPAGNLPDLQPQNDAIATSNEPVAKDVVPKEEILSPPKRTLLGLPQTAPSSSLNSPPLGGGGVAIVPDVFPATPAADEQLSSDVDSVSSTTASTSPNPVEIPWAATSTYDKTTFTINLAWPEKENADSYDVKEEGGSFAAVIMGTSTQISTTDMGRKVRYTVSAQDADKNIIATSSVEVRIPTLWKQAFFYNHPKDGPVLEFSFDSYPFIPSSLGESTYQAILGYLNIDPLIGNTIISSWDGFNPGNSSETVTLAGARPYIFGTNPGYCRGWGGGMLNFGCLPKEDLRARVTVGLPDGRAPQEGDFLTLAYYDMFYSGGATYNMSRVSRDFLHIPYTSNIPADLHAPDPPTAKNISFDKQTAVLSFDVLPQSDSDSPDGELAVSWAFTTGIPTESDWKIANSVSSHISIGVTSSQEFTISLKATDSTGLTAYSSQKWQAPAGYVFLPRQEYSGDASFPADSLGQYIKLPVDADISAVVFRILKVDLRYYKFGFSRVQIYEDNNGEHGASVATSSATVSWDPYFQDMQYDFASPVHLKTGVGYWFAVETPPDGDPWYSVPVSVLGTSNADAYPEGGYNTITGPDARFWFIRTPE